jgi:hypothetical protein
MKNIVDFESDLAPCLLDNLLFDINYNHISSSNIQLNKKYCLRI